ncbi:tetratricopeptide repeat protein [bacterium]|nr:tetratricopeptide repeat protein [bacterium]
MLPNEEQALIHADRAQRLVQEGRFSDAVNECISALQHDARHAGACLLMAELQAMGGHLEPALSFASRAVREDYGNVRAWTMLANIYCQLGGVYLVLALEQIDMGLSLDPNNANLHYLKGNCHAQLGERNLARDAYKKALEQNPKHPFALYDSQALALAEEQQQQ